MHPCPTPCLSFPTLTGPGFILPSLCFSSDRQLHHYRVLLLLPSFSSPVPTICSLIPDWRDPDGPRSEPPHPPSLPWNQPLLRWGVLRAASAWGAGLQLGSRSSPYPLPPCCGWRS